MSETMIQYPHDGSYHFVGDVDKFKDINGFMTGAEWLARLEIELKKPWTDEEIVEPYYQHDDQIYVYSADHVMEAAKRASGTEDE